MNDPNWWWRQLGQLEYERELQRSTTRKNPPVDRAKQRAYNAVHRAILKGELPSLSSLQCSTPTCTNTAQVYHHHMGYAPPNQTNVVPMCKRCHAGHPPESR
jgi:hypothetical protein